MARPRLFSRRVANTVQRRSPPAPRSGWLRYAVIVACVWLAGQIVIALLVQRAPITTALSVAPRSPSVLARAAEAELAADRVDNAVSLSAESLQRAPFNARALRVLGIALGREGQPLRAEEAVTLAGNWSLRDDPSHAWLIERRLRDGSYASAFAHADTLVRRRLELQPLIFDLFDRAALSDPRAIPSITRLVAADPPWRSAYIAHLTTEPEAAAWMLSLSVNLQRTARPLSDVELSSVYWALLRRNQLSALQWLADQTAPPATETRVIDGGFEGDQGVAPFAWTFEAEVGSTAEVVEDDTGRHGESLRIETDGYHGGTIARQLIRLAPGDYTLTGLSRIESSGHDAGVAVSVICATGGPPLGEVRIGLHQVEPSEAWTAFRVPVAVRKGCQLQWLTISTIAGSQRTFDVTWLDQIAVAPAGTRSLP